MVHHRVGLHRSDMLAGYPIRVLAPWPFSLQFHGAFAWGMYQVGQVCHGSLMCRALKEENYAARRAILPILQAEEDERFVSEWKKYLDYEADVMKDVPGWKVGENVYNSGRWMPPATGELRPDVW
ncbi:unnamed protein product [Brassica oleracea]|uniref:NADH dehydrogenase [ubiquinone] 1 alpha subcomplex subunit 13 n=1 Tax=Brassica napus TaxID=3708 RepID=A0A816VRR8_BRANA|nr:unnamed protein product [Brassica napus]